MAEIKDGRLFYKVDGEWRELPGVTHTRIMMHEDEPPAGSPTLDRLKMLGWYKEAARAAVVEMENVVVIMAAPTKKPGTYDWLDVWEYNARRRVKLTDVNYANAVIKRLVKDMKLERRGPTHGARRSKRWT